MPRQVRRAAHDPAERIHLAHDRALGDPADRGIAGHLADGLEILGQQQASALRSAPTSAEASVPACPPPITMTS